MRSIAENDELQRTILSELTAQRLARVVSTNKVIGTIRVNCPQCDLSDRQLASLVTELAIRLGLIPVFDPSK